MTQTPYANLGPSLAVYDDIMNELKARGVYMCERFAPFYICSYAVHAFNLMNQRRHIYWEGGMLTNMRAHVLFVAPRGYMKTYYGRNMVADEWAIFKGCKIGTNREQSMTEAGLVGTFENQMGISGVEKPGIAKVSKNNIIFIDEFKAVSEALKNPINNQMEPQLLSALDDGHVVKRLASGKIEYQTFLTTWGGVQPASYDLASGLGRRLVYILFLPTERDDKNLSISIAAAQNKPANEANIRALWAKIDGWIDDMENIQHIEFAPEVHQYLDELGVFSFERSNFYRLILGYHLAKHGCTDRHLILKCEDEEIREMLRLCKKWRDDIQDGIDLAQMKKIIAACGGTATYDDIFKGCRMVGWNRKQMFEIIGNMKNFHMVEVKGDVVALILPKH